MHLSKLFRFSSSEIQSVVSHRQQQVWWVGILVGLLLLILNIFLSGHMFTRAFVDQLQTKLGMYFYISDDIQNDEQIYTRVVDLTRELENNNLETVFASKQEAFAVFENRVPWLAQTFESLQIDNPLPATLYVMFEDEQEYNILKNVILEYKDVIVNVDDIQEHATLKQQEQRVLQVLHVSRYVQIVGYILALVLFITIAFLGGFLLKGLFDSLHTKIAIKHLLGASKDQLLKPFVVLTSIVLVIAYVTTLVSFLISLVLSYVVAGPSLFLSIMEHIGSSIVQVIVFVFVQLVLYTVVCLGLTVWYVWYLSKK
jgi:cell division protein FtsX